MQTSRVTYTDSGFTYYSPQALHPPPAAARMSFDAFSQINSSVWLLNDPMKKVIRHTFTQAIAGLSEESLLSESGCTLDPGVRRRECWLLNFLFMAYLAIMLKVMHSSGRQLPAWSSSCPINTFLQFLPHLTLIRGTLLLADIKHPRRIYTVRWAVAACSGYSRAQKRDVWVWQLTNRCLGACLSQQSACFSQADLLCARGSGLRNVPPSQWKREPWGGWARQAAASALQHHIGSDHKTFLCLSKHLILLSLVGHSVVLNN